MGFLIYTLCSGIACYGYSKLFVRTISETGETLGYVSVGEKEKIKFSKRVLNFALNFIPVLSTVGALGYLGLSIYLCCGNRTDIEEIFMKNPYYRRASEAKEVLEIRERTFNLGTLQDAMILDGADDEIIASELKKIKSEGCVPTKKELNKVRAMSDAEDWLNSVELDTSLTDREKEELYDDYVKDFSRSKSNGKVLQKTLRIARNKED